MKADPIWRPSPRRATNCHLRNFATRFAPAPARKDYRALHQWSVSAPDKFWRAVADYARLPFSTPPETILDAGESMPDARWFRGARLNFAEALLETEHDAPALDFANERGDRRTLSRPALKREVARTAAFLVRKGVGVGDHVAGILPNGPEAVIAALATARIGAVWSSCSPDFGETALLDRLGQLAPKVLFGTGAYYYGGKLIDCIATLSAISTALDSVLATVVVPYAADASAVAAVPQGVDFAAMPETDTPPPYVQLPFDAPLYVLFSSGTTGAPKCIVHGAGGTLLQHSKEHLLHTDIHPGDRLFYFTTCGWMMWNWLVSALSAGATLILYDGSPFHPDPGVLWRLAETLRIDIFGTSARYLAALQAAEYAPAQHHDLSRVRSILSTGSPLPPDAFQFVSESIGDHIQVASIAGGTDIVSCFVLGNPTLPVYSGEIQCPGLGMDVRILDPVGNDLPTGKGELACAEPFPSMPIGFLDDRDGRKYHAAYFERFPGVWCHGDFAEFTENGGIIIHGRSDAVLNPGGVRIGTAEIYRVVDGLTEIAESVAVGQDHGSDTRVVLFIKLSPEAALTDALRDRIRYALRTQCSPRHVPELILSVDAIPQTLSGKISELAVRDVIHGRQVSNLTALANPEALEHFRDRVELSL